MLLNFAIVGVTVLVAALLWSRRIRGLTTWSAMSTPLASIIGSGFLILGPILMNAYGVYAPVIMAGLCLTAYGFGAAIRFNIQTLSNDARAPDPVYRTLETTASWALGVAYMISVAYYLNLFGAFGVSLISGVGPIWAKLLTTAMFLMILAVGWTRGFKSLERLEYISVTAKLAIIGGLLVGLAVFLAGKVSQGIWAINPPQVSGLAALTLAFGLIVTVQGFETARYLGAEYDAPTRVQSMKGAQWLSGGIYMGYILLLSFAFEQRDLALSETAIVDMMAVVAPVLPVLLVGAALAAQFSAAVADTGGSGGLIVEMSGNRIQHAIAYALLAGVGLILTWTSNVFEIVSFASRGFAAYYALQAAIAARFAWRQGCPWRAGAFGMLGALGVAICAFGQAVET